MRYDKLLCMERDYVIFEPISIILRNITVDSMLLYNRS